MLKNILHFFKSIVICFLLKAFFSGEIVIYYSVKINPAFHKKIIHSDNHKPKRQGYYRLAWIVNKMMGGCIIFVFHAS